MTSNPSVDDEIASTDDFEAVLGQILLASVKNDIDPRGSWEYRTNGPSPNFEVMVFELE